MIYLLEDDDSIRDFVIYTLNSQGMEARGFPLPSLFWQAVRTLRQKLGEAGAYIETVRGYGYKISPVN